MEGKKAFLDRLKEDTGEITPVEEILNINDSKEEEKPTITQEPIYVENKSMNTIIQYMEIKTMKETKSKRANVLLYPSLYEKAKSIADDNGISVNEYINIALTVANKKYEEEKAQG